MELNHHSSEYQSDAFTVKLHAHRTTKNWWSVVELNQPTTALSERASDR